MKIHEYNEMMSYLTRPGMKQGGVIGEGGMFQGEDLGYRTGFSRLRGDPKIALTKSGEPRKGLAEQFRTYLRGLDKEVLKNSTLKDLVLNSKLEYSTTAASNVLLEDEFLKIRPKRTLNPKDKTKLIKLLKNKTGRLESVTYKGVDYFKGGDGRIREKVNLKADRPEAYAKQQAYELKKLNLIKSKDIFPYTGKDVKFQIWRDLYESTRKRTYGNRAGDFKGPEPRLKVVTRLDDLTTDAVKNKLILLDTKTNKKITFKNLEKYINSLPGTSFKEMSLPYKYKNWLADQTISYKGKTNVSLRTVLRENLLTKNQLNNWKASPYQVHHPFGINENPFKVQLAMHKPNGLEGHIRLDTLKKLEAAGTDEELVKKIMLSYKKKIKALPGGIQSGVRNELVGKALEPEAFIKSLFSEAKIGREARPLVKKFEETFTADQTKLKATIVGENTIKAGITVCTKGGGKVMKASGGRIGYGQKCYSGQALMDFVRENPEEAMKAFKASKEVNASMAKNPSKWLKAGRITARELGPLGLIGGEILFGGALTAMELGQGKDVWEAMDNGFLYGLAGVEEKNLLKYADTFNLSDEEKEYFKAALDVSKKAPAYVKILDTMSNMDPTKLTTTEPGARGMGEGRERPTPYARYKTLADKKLAEINALKGDLTKDQFLKGNIFLKGSTLAKGFDETTLKADRKAATEQAMQNIEAYNQFDFDPWSAAEGGRAGFGKGSPKSPGRRTFIKGLGALAVLPIVGKFFKMADVANVAKRTKTYTGPAIGKVKGMPEWFPGLVKKLWNEGDDVTKQVAITERQIVKRGTLESGDDIDLIYHADTGDVSINVTPKKGTDGTSSGAFNKEYELNYTKGQADEMTKGKKPPDEFQVTETEPVRTGHPEDPDWDWDGIDTTVDDAITDLTEIEAFSKSKSVKQIHKKKGTKPKDVNPEVEYDDSYDPETGIHYNIDD